MKDLLKGKMGNLSGLEHSRTVQSIEMIRHGIVHLKMRCNRSRLHSRGREDSK